MITVPRGWRANHIADALVLTPPSDSTLGTLRYIEKRRPLRAIDELVRADGMPSGFVARSMSAPRRMLTAEGEHAVLVTCEGRMGGTPAELSFGYVLLDDFYASLTGIALGDPPAMRAVMTQMLVSDVHVLGWSRRRRYSFAPPAGWCATGDTFEHPGTSARIFVGPALPVQAGLVNATLDKLVGGIDRLPARSMRPRERISTRHGLTGDHHRLRLRGDGVASDVFFLVDDAFMYSVRVDGDAKVGQTLVDTIEPIARPRPPQTDVFRFWAE